MTLYNNLVSKLTSPYVEKPLLKYYTTLKIGGPADLLITVGNLHDLALSVSFLTRYNIPWYLLGEGSNVLVSDAGFSGVVIKLGENFNYITPLGNHQFIVGGKTPLPKMANELIRLGYTGIEWASGIPGTVGGASLMNAGAFDGDMAQIITKLSGINYHRNKLQIEKAQIEFGYRYTSLINEHIIITSVIINLPLGNSKNGYSKKSELKEQRQKLQPKFPSAGSVFKNPDNDFAGRLIDACGLRGYQIGGAQISTKHANFIVNHKNATSQDVWKLINMVKNTVIEAFGITLELEIETLGEM